MATGQVEIPMACGPSVDVRSQRCLLLLYRVDAKLYAHEGKFVVRRTREFGGRPAGMDSLPKVWLQDRPAPLMLPRQLPTDPQCAGHGGCVYRINGPSTTEFNTLPLHDSPPGLG